MDGLKPITPGKRDLYGLELWPWLGASRMRPTLLERAWSMAEGGPTAFECPLGNGSRPRTVLPGAIKGALPGSEHGCVRSAAVVQST